MIAAAVDACYARQLYFNKHSEVAYSENILGLPKGISEFNAGVLLINLKKWRDDNLTSKCLDKLAEIGTPRVLDQCILNAVIKQDDIYKLPVEWNYVWHAELENLEPITKSNTFNEIIDNYNKKINQIKIIHYTSGVKPWNIYDSYPNKTVIGYLAEEWWSTAAKTGIYTQLLASNVIKTYNNERINFNNVKKFYLFNLRIFKIKQTEHSKIYYLFNIPIIKIKNFY